MQPTQPSGNWSGGARTGGFSISLPKSTRSTASPAIGWSKHTNRQRELIPIIALEHQSSLAKFQEIRIPHPSRQYFAGQITRGDLSHEDAQRIQAALTTCQTEYDRNVEELAVLEPRVAEFGAARAGSPAAGRGIGGLAKRSGLSLRQFCPFLPEVPQAEKSALLPFRQTDIMIGAGRTYDPSGSSPKQT